jgi:threonylcarbamoyladenosine tRNA methylthiotransferase MtaB
MSDKSHLSGKNFSVITLGCRVNRCEAEAIAAMLERRGARFAGDGAASGADIVIVVTCSVTSMADAKTRKTIRRARRESPEALIVACGCWAQGAEPDAARSIGVDVLVGSRMKETLADALEEWYEARNGCVIRRTDVSRLGDWDDLPLDRPRIGARAFVKVQDGCDRRCSYCVVSSLRGASVSRAPEDAVDEVRRVVAGGTMEVVLTGVQIGGYRRDGVSLAGLIRMISRVPGLRRLRLGSLEPFAATEELLASMSESEAFCPHLHLPLQSGDDGVLKAMRRGYDSAGFARVVAAARRYLGDDAHISTDLIVGFPGESERAFANSLSLLESLAIDRTHVFPYSPRAGTESAAMPLLPAAVVKERTSRALALSEKLSSGYAAKMVGKPDAVLIESVDGGVASGWSRHYTRFYIKVHNTENNLTGNEFIAIPKQSIGSILLCEGVGREEIIFYTDE